MRITRHRSSLIGLLEQVRRFESNPTDLSRLLDIHRTLTRSISGVKRVIVRQNDNSKELKHRIRTERASKDEARRLKTQLSAISSRIKYYKWPHFVYRSIGDALAFTIFSKWDLKPLAFKESPGWLTGKKGGRLESRIAGGLISRGVPAIRCDLTNTLRYGDIAIRLYDEIFLFEVKSVVQGSTRGERQLNAINRLLTYFATDKIDGLYGRPRIVRRAMHAAPIDHVAELNALIREARLTNSSVVTEMEPGVTYAVLRSCDESALSTIVTNTANPILFMPNTEKDAGVWTGYCPFTLSLRDPIDVLDFLEDHFILVVAIDIDHIRKISDDIGYHADILGGDPFIRFSAIDKSSSVPELMASRHFFGRLGFEFLSLRWLITEALQPIDGALVEQFDDV